MINKKDLRQYIIMKIKIERLSEKIEKLNEDNKIVKDSVKASSNQFPYIQYTYTAEGFENSRNKSIYKKILKSKKEQLEKRTNNVIYELEKMEDEEMSLLLTLKYIDGLNHVQIANHMTEKSKKIYSDDSVRKKIERFFEKNEKK